jgi:hypothetical protein
MFDIFYYDTSRTHPLIWATTKESHHAKPTMDQSNERKFPGQCIGTGGRAGRKQYEVLVAMSSITGDTDANTSTVTP